MRRGLVARIVVPVLAATGIAYAVYFSTMADESETKAPNLLALPAESRFPSTVSGSGLIEANTRNIAVASFEPGVVTEVAVTEGQRVDKGALLFALDRRVAESRLDVAMHAVAAAEAKAAEAEADLADREDQFDRRRRLERGVVISVDALARLRFAAQTARAAVAAAQAEVMVAQAQLAAARVDLDRRSVYAPVAGRILKVNVRPGEFVSAAALAEPAVLMGDDRPLHVRVQVDENDLWRLRADARADAVIRGNRDIRFPLKFVRVEPYVLPKRSLTGDTTERIDTRVLEIIYSFDPGDRPVYIGQQVDVFIDAGGSGGSATPPPPAGPAPQS